MENNNSEHEDDFVQIQERIPNTHILIYRDQEYPINFELLKYSSKYFYDHQNEIMCNNRIELVNYDPDGNIPDLSPSSIETFIKYINREQIRLTNENISTLNYLAHKYEMDELIRSTERYIERHPEACLSILTIHQNDGQISTGIYETIIARNLNDYINNEEMLDLQVPTLYRILANNSNEINLNEKIEKNNFLLKTLDKYGREASVLFEFADLDDQENDFFEILLDKYIDVFDFSFIGSAVLSELLKEREKRNTERRMHEEDKRSLEENHNKLKKQQMLAIENLKHELLERENQEKIVFKEHQSEKNELNQKIEQINIEKEGLMKEIKKINEKSIDHTKEITKLRGELENKKKEEEMQNQTHQAEVNKLNKNIEQISKEKEELKTEVQKLNNKNIDLKNEITKLRGELEDKKKEEEMQNQAHRTEVNKLIKNIEQISKEKEELKTEVQKLNNKNTEIDDLKREINELRIELENEQKEEKIPKQTQELEVIEPNEEFEQIKEEKVKNKKKKKKRTMRTGKITKRSKKKEKEENVSEIWTDSDSDSEKLIKENENKNIWIDNAEPNKIETENIKLKADIYSSINENKDIHNAETATFKDINGICYEISLNNQTASVIDAPKEKTSIKIPKFIKYQDKTYNVQNINDGAFTNSKIEELYIPSTITTVAPNSCLGACNLKMVEVDQANQSFSYKAFQGCISLSKIKLTSNSTIKITNSSFEDLNSLQSVDIIAKKVIISDECFNNFSSLNSVEISGDQVNIGNNCFSLKKLDNFTHSIENIKIHSNNVEIENKCFNCLCTLKSFNIQSKKVNIGKECFKKCDSLSSFSISDASEVFLDSHQFEECSKLKNLQLKSSSILRLGLNCLFNSTGIEKVSLESKEVYIDKGCFFGCSSLAAFQITNCEQITIMDNAFLGCNKLASLSFDSLKFIKLANSCFSECARLQSINLNTPNVEIGDSCFNQCTALTSVLFNRYMYSSTSRVTNRVNFQIESVTIGKNCFEGCSSLSAFNLSEVGKAKIDSQAFKGCSKLDSLQIQGNEICLEDDLIKDCTFIKNAKLLSNSFLIVPNKFFKDVTSLQSVEIAGEKVVIGKNCFENCFNIQKSTGDNSQRGITVKSNSSVEIGKSCFIGSKYLESVTFSGGQIIFGSDCFNNCTSLKNFTLENFVYVELGINSLTGCNPSYFTATPSSKISLDNYFEYIDDLESNDSGKLFLVQKRGSDDVFAAKVINKRLQLSYDRNNFLKEMILSTRINYPVIDNVIGFSLKGFNNEDWPTVITKHPGNISLKNAMKNANLSGTQKHIILLGTALGMKYLHSEKIPLNSLTTNEIFLDEEFRPHIKYYGCNEDKQENYKIDVRSFLLIAYELITGQPLKDKSDLHFIKDDKIREFFKKCFVFNNLIEFKDILAEFTNEQYSQLFESNDQEIVSYLKDFGITDLTSRIKFTNIYYNISRSSLQAEIVGCEKVKDNLSVLEYINFKGTKYNITRIGDHAFTGAQIKKLDFNPNSHVYSIGCSAFENSLLKEIYLPPSVEEIGNYCFCGLKNLEILHFKGKTLTLGKGCFEDCQSLELVTFECTEDINIGSESFKKCSQLKRFESQGVNISLGESCFSDASALSANEFKCDKLTIEKNCFENCTSLKSFACKGIKSISIGSKAFYGCCALVIISLMECSNVSFKEECLSHISKLNQLCVQSDVILLGNNIASCCQSLAYINLFSTQSFTISSNVFLGCYSLTSITLMSQSTIQLSKKSFICANNLQIASIEGNQIIVEDEVFKSLKKLQSITFSCDELKIGNSVLGFCSELSSFMLNNVKKAEFGSNVFTDCTKLSTIRFEATMSLTVGDNCFSGVNSLQNVSILSEKLNIGNNCFKNCRNLSSITFPNAQSIEIGSNAFEGCSKLNSSINITTFSELTIGDECFKSLENIKYLTLASEKITIGKNAFNECKNLSSIIFNSALNISIGPGAFSKCIKLDKIFISVVSNVTLSDDCFNSASNIQNATLSGEEIKIGSRCFKFCTKLSSVSLTKGKNVTFGSNVFERSNLKKLVISATSKVVLAKYCFHHAESLESVTINCEDIDVGERCFNNCKALNSIYIQKVKNAKIGPYSFRECYNLRKFTLNAPLNLTICNNCFRESCIHEVNLTGGNLTIGDYAFYDSTISSAYITSTSSHIFTDNAFFRNGDFRPKFTLERKKY